MEPDSARWSLAGLCVGLGVVALGFVVPPPAGLTTSGWRALAIVGAAVALWFSESLPPAVTGLLVIILLAVLRVIPLEQALRGFSDPSLALLVGVFLLGAAMEHTGFARRLALRVVQLGKGVPSRTVFCVTAATMLFVFLLPSSAGRAAILVPIAAGIARALGLEPGSNLGRAMLVAVPITSLVFASAVMTGALSMVYAAGVFEATLGYRWTYTSWLQTMAPIGTVTVLVTCPLLLLCFRPERSACERVLEYVRRELDRLGPVSGAEWRVAALCALMVALWLTSARHHLPVAVPALIAGVLSVMPRVGVLKWAEASSRISWDTIILFGAGLSSAVALQRTGAVEWLASRFLGWVGELPPALMVVMLMIAIAVLRLGFSSVLACMAVVLPLVFALGQTAGVDPVWLGLVGVIASDSCLFLPMQSPTSMIAYSAGYFRVADFFRAGAVVFAVLALVTLGAAMWYWPRLGIGIR